MIKRVHLTNWKQISTIAKLPWQSYPSIWKIPQWEGLLRSRDKPDKLISTYNDPGTPGHQARQQGAGLQWEFPISKATWLFDQMTNKKSRDNLDFYISIITRLMTSKTGKVLTYGRILRMKTPKSSPTFSLI